MPATVLPRQQLAFRARRARPTPNRRRSWCGAGFDLTIEAAADPAGYAAWPVMVADVLAAQFQGSSVFSSFCLVRPETTRSSTSAKFASEQIPQPKRRYKPVAAWEPKKKPSAVTQGRISKCSSVRAMMTYARMLRARRRRVKELAPVSNAISENLLRLPTDRAKSPSRWALSCPAKET